jgi:hypothetical protein
VTIKSRQKSRHSFWGWLRQLVENEGRLKLEKIQKKRGRPEYSNYFTIKHLVLHRKGGQGKMEKTIHN